MSDTNLYVAEPSVNWAEICLDEKWKGWCRLCAKADGQYINVISGQCLQQINENGINYDKNMAHVIGTFFRVHIEEDDKLSQVICAECCGSVTNLIQFSERVNKVQQMYNELQNFTGKEKPDLHLLFVKYGILKDESLIPQCRTALPVEEIFVADLASLDVGDVQSINVKPDKVSTQLQGESLLQNEDKKDGFHDPIADDEGNIYQNPYNSSEEEGSSGSENKCNNKDASEFENRMIRNNRSRKILKKCPEISEVVGMINDHSCSICSQRFQRRSTYSTHLKKKHGVIICSQCPSSFKSESNLKRHMNDHQKFFSCIHCDEKFEKKGSMSNHIRNEHKSYQPFVCEACGEALRTKKQLKQHMLIHSDYTPYKCKECEKSFKEKYRLKRHLEIHGDKHICTECGKQLSCRATLNMHMLVHSDKMPHKCDYCGRTFKRAKTLKYHLIAHTGLRPYSCDFCEKTFSTGSSCRFHKKTMHPSELAALEASGAKTYTKNVPNLDVLRAVARTGENFMPLASKQKGYVNLKYTREIQSDEVRPTDAVIMDK